jgi:hypothetical protein
VVVALEEEEERLEVTDVIEKSSSLADVGGQQNRKIQNFPPTTKKILLFGSFSDPSTPRTTQNF